MVQLLQCCYWCLKGNHRRRGALAGGKGERQMPKDFAHHENPFIHVKVHWRDELWYSIWGEPNTYLRRTCFNSGELSRTKFYPRRIDLWAIRGGSMLVRSWIRSPIPATAEKTIATLPIGSISSIPVNLKEKKTHHLFSLPSEKKREG